MVSATNVGFLTDGKERRQTTGQEGSELMAISADR